MEKIIFEITILEIILSIILIIGIIVIMVMMICTLVGDEFYRMPVINQWLTSRRNLYRVGYKNGLEHKTIKEYDLKHDRKIQRLEKKLNRAQKEYDELYLLFQKYKFQRDEK